MAPKSADPLRGAREGVEDERRQSRGLRLAESFADMAAMGSTTWGEVEVQQDLPARLTISAVSASFFDTLGAQALLGRTFLPEEDAAEAERVLVLSHAAWRQYFDLRDREPPRRLARDENLRESE